MNQENLHPMNRADFPQPNWDDPDWEPSAYPSLGEVLSETNAGTALNGLSNSDCLKMADSIRDEAAARWPTLSDYLKYLYDDQLPRSEMLRYFEPRRIVPPGGYPSPKCVAASLYSMFAELKLKCQSDVTILPTEITALLLSYKVVAAHVPIFYVSDDFIRAVAATDLPGDFTLQDLHWPMPAMVLAFPPKFLKEVTGREIGYVFAADLDAGDHAPPPWVKGLPTISCPPKIAFQVYSYERGLMEMYVASWLKRDRLNEIAGKYCYTDYTEAPPEKVDNDHAMVEKIGALLLKMLVVLNTRPGYIEAQHLTRRSKRNKKGVPVQTELWAPNVIGFNYRAQRQDAAGGAHASPRYHWRRGHITHQRTGSHKAPEFVSIVTLPVIAEGVNKGHVDWLAVPDETRAAFWKCHIRRWVEPCLINFEEAV